MRGRIAFLVVVLSALLLAACGGGGGGGGGPIHPLPPSDGNGTPPPPPPNDYTWTVMYYVAADNDLALPSLEETLQLAELDNYSDKVAVVLQGEYWDDNLDRLRDVAPDMDEAVDLLESTVPRTRLTNPDDPDDPNDQELSRENFNSASPAALKSFLVWAKTHFPADHYMLVLSGHGTSWRTHRSVSGILNDDGFNGGNPLSTKEVATAIQAAGLHLDVLDLTSCVMGNIEVALDFEPVADYLVFSQTYMKAGREYQTTVQSYINSHPSVSPRSLASYVVSSYNNYYQTGDYEEAVTLSAVDLGKVDAVVEALGDVASQAVADSALTPNDLRAARRSSQQFYCGLNVDLLDILNEIEPLAGSSTKLAISGARNAFDDFVVASMFKAGESPKEETSPLLDACGISIYFPNPPSYVVDYLDEYTQLDFEGRTSWKGVISKMYSGVEPYSLVPGGFRFALEWDSNVDIDLYVIEAYREGADEEDTSVASPWFSTTGQDGNLTADSTETGFSHEAYEAQSRVHDGYYVVFADYYSDGWGVIGWHWHTNVTLIVLDQNDSEIWRSEPVYMDIETPYDPYLEGYGVHVFGGLHWNGSRWVFETPDKLPASAKSVARLERPRAKPGLPPRTTEAPASH